MNQLAPSVSLHPPAESSTRPFLNCSNWQQYEHSSSPLYENWWSGSQSDVLPTDSPSQTASPVSVEESSETTGVSSVTQVDIFSSSCPNFLDDAVQIPGRIQYQKEGSLVEHYRSARSNSVANQTVSCKPKAERKASAPNSFFKFASFRKRKLKSGDISILEERSGTPILHPVDSVHPISNSSFGPEINLFRNQVQHPTEVYCGQVVSERIHGLYIRDRPPPLPPARSVTMSLTSLISVAEKDLQVLTAKTKDCDGLWQTLKELQSHFVIKLTEIQQLKAFHSQQLQVHNGQAPNKQKLDQIKSLLDSSNRHAGQLYQTLVDTRKAILVTLNDCADFVGKLRNELVNKVLLEWKRGQKLAQIGFPFDRQDELLDKIAHLFEQLAEEAWSLRTYAVWIKDLLQQAPNLPDNNVQQCLTVLQPMGAAITKELQSLVRESFIVSKQPNVVLKQHNKFTAETRLLVGDKLGFKFLNLKVGVKLISEDHARALKDGSLAVQQATTVAKIGFGPISNSSGDSQDVNLEVERESKRVRACFKSRLLKVDPRKSGGKNNDDQQQMLVCERNYALLFTCSPFQLTDISFPCVWTLSLPVKLTVHGSQERLSQAMILWDHAFAPPEAPFNVPEAVEWHLLAEALKSKFLVQTGATRGLSKSDLEYLAEKCLDSATLASSPNVSKHLVTLQRFSKDPMREGVEFSFWHWFFDIMALIKQKLLRFWDDGFVKGFIGRSAASDLLLSQQQPSFLLRFSDTHVGGLSISFAVIEEGRKEIFPLAPFTVKDLDHLSLAQRIAGCPQLQGADTVVGADAMLFEKSAIFRKEAEMMLRQRPTGPVDKDGHPYILSDLVMIARINNRSGTESTPLSPLPHGSWSPNGESNQGMLDAVGATESWDGTSIDMNNIDWRSMGILPCSQQQPILASGSDEPDTACKVSPGHNTCNGGVELDGGADGVVSMQELLNFITGDGPQDPHFQRQLEEQQRSMAQATPDGGVERMDDEEMPSNNEHGDVDFEWDSPSQR